MRKVCYKLASTVHVNSILWFKSGFVADTMLCALLIFLMTIFRNAVLEREANKVGCSLPAARKTGTTICGLVFKVSERNQDVLKKEMILCA